MQNVERYDPALNTWIWAIDMTCQRSGAGAGVFEKILQAVCGPLVRNSIEKTIQCKRLEFIIKYVIKYPLPLFFLKTNKIKMKEKIKSTLVSLFTDRGQDRFGWVNCAKFVSHTILFLFYKIVQFVHNTLG
jgi:hypothetical protein